MARCRGVPLDHDCQAVAQTMRSVRPLLAARQTTRLASAQLPRDTRRWTSLLDRTGDKMTVDTRKFIEHMNEAYNKVHSNYEHNFWATKMALKGNSSEELARTKNEYDAFLASAENLKAVREQLKAADLDPEERKVLEIMQKTFSIYITEDPSAVAIKEKLTQLEAELQQARNTLALGYTDPATSQFVKSSSVQLRNVVRVNDDEATRKAAYEGMRSIGPFVAERFLEIVKLRNKLAKSCGYIDFYDYKVTQAEGFGKIRLFEILDDLETKTRPVMESARKTLAEAKGAAALEPHNISYTLAGDTEKAMDPYFPFETAVDVWARTFAALGIHYKGATMRLDLCDRDGKYSNGFLHAPVCPNLNFDGTFTPCQANFTSLATPSQVGSGKTALVTLLHEGGHAAHFSNIRQHSPFFSQERAPMSVAYAENQSMYLDSYAGDAAWLGRYAHNREGKPVPFDVLAEHLKATQPYTVFGLRAMIAVPYFEKALYELPEDQLTVENLLSLADKVETDIQGGLSPRPLMSVPHILSDESACYYHGYVLAEMSVHQTRAYFKAKYGALVDNPAIGKDLAEVYWKPGNSEPFLDLVNKLTGKPLLADDWVAHLAKPLSEVLVEEQKDYDEAVAKGPAIPAGTPFDLGMRVILQHGDEVIGDSDADGGLAGACAKFQAWVQRTYFGRKE